MKNHKRYTFVLISSIFVSLLSLSYAQEIKTLKLGDSIKGRMEIDESHEYFQMSISGIDKDSVLIFKTRENKETEIKSDEVFSDPDFYISKINKYPSSKQTSEWFSERYGSDVLTVPSDSLNDGDILYVGMYCQFKCRYFLQVYISKEFGLDLNKFHFLNIKAQETMNYKVYMDKDFEELNVVAYSRNGGKFRIFMNKEGPSSQNTFNVIPSWVNGYVINVKKTDTHRYCTKCYYHILIQNEGSDDINSLLIYAAIYGTELQIPKDMPLYDAMDKHAKRCYYYNITSEEKKEQKLIIQTTMFSGNMVLSINGWEPSGEGNQLLSSDNEYTYKIYTEQFVILNKSDFEKFDSRNKQYEGKDSVLHFCYYSKPESSFSISVFYLTNLEKLQKQQESSILVPGNKLRSYLAQGQKMIYLLTGHNLEKIKYDIQTNITVNTFDVVGTTKSYIYYCLEESCNIQNNQIDDYVSKNILKPLVKKDFETSEIIITNNNNECYKKPNTTLANGNIISCRTYAIIYCETPNQEGLCIFDAQHIVQDDPLLMRPKQIFYGKLPLGKIDYYNIIITDTNINSLVVVLNSESGDAELLLFKKTTEGNLNSKEGRLISVSLHNDYIPDVVRVTPSKLGKEDIVGDYLVKVTPTTFSTYYIYYYVTYNKDANEDKDEEKKFPEVTLNLEIGQVITDYFPYDIRYKIYSFTPLSEKKANLKIFIDRVNVDFFIYVYRDISTFKILPFYEVPSNKDKEIISGYDWKSDGDNEVIIESTDEKLEFDKMYYIVIAPNVPEINEQKLHSPPNEGKEEIISPKAAIQFYLGVTESNEEITITEGVPHTMTLDEYYNEQAYYYEHTDIKKDFELEINVYTGEIDVFIDIEEITLERIKSLKGEEEINTDGTMTYKLGILDAYDSIVISSEFFQKYGKSTDGGVPLYFLIKRSESSVEDNIDCKYSIVEFSSENKAEILQPGLVKSSELAPGEKAYYIIEEVKKRKGSAITVTFDGGVGAVFVRIPETPEDDDDIRFPSLDNYDYMGESIFTSKIVTIPEEVYQRLDDENTKLQILVTVEVYDSDEDEDPDKEDETIDSNVEYTISYSNEPKTLNQNSPYDGFISQGENQYYTFYFDENAENIYIGLSNMNGDADMYLNYGSTLPTPNACDWKSNSASHEYIDFNVKDKFFVTNKIENISGYYTLLITGFVDTTFSLFISSHKEPVLPLRNNRPITCLCEEAGEQCYLRYNEVFDSENKKNGILHNDIIFSTKYIYGGGIMYAKLLKDFELHGKDFYKFFPSETEYDMSNKESNQRNFMKMQIQGEQFTEDSSILMTFVCKEKTRVEITPTILRHYDTIDYIGENKENTFYIGYNEISGEKPELELYFYNFEFDQDLVYSIHSFEGDAHFTVYSNDSRWDIDKQEIINDYYLFKEFEITSMNYTDNEMDVFNPYSEDYHNYISVEELKNHQSIIFKIQPKSEFGFSIQCNYDKNWNFIPLGNSKSYYALHHEFYGYFDISNEYSDIELSISLEENVLLTANAYVKINIIDTTKKNQFKGTDELSEFSLYDYSYPNEKNYDYFTKTDSILGSLTININKLPKLTEEEQKTKFVRALIFVKLYPSDFEPMEDEEDEEENARRKRFHRQWEHWNGVVIQELIDILITPGVNNYKYIDAYQYTYYLSNLTYEKGINKIPEKKIYTLIKKAPEDDVMVIELSRCKGNYEIEITDKLTMNNYENTGQKVKYEDSVQFGKRMIYIFNLTSDVYYLTITAKQSDFICKLRTRNKTCANDLTYLMHYYTGSKKKLAFSTLFSYSLIPRPYGKGKVEIILPRRITKDIDANKTNINNYKFDVFISEDKDDYESMGSVCFLRNYNETESLIKVKNVRLKKGKSLIVSGLGYRKKYYLNVLVQNTLTMELITFTPIEVWAGGLLPFPLWQTGLGNLILIILIIVLIVVCRKYKGVKEELKVIKGDTLPKTESEVSADKGEDKIRYSGLGESY